jgi:patatin-like phospholipase/acyl hydrolase
LARVDFVAREELATINPCVLSIDGGGIKGCIALAFWSTLQEALDPNIPLQGYFDLFVGTSSGSSAPYRTIAISEFSR